MDNILFLLIVIIIINIYIVFNQHQLLYKNNITPLLQKILSKPSPLPPPVKKKTLCNNPTIINDIKQYYKKSAINNNDFESEITNIININLVNDDSNGLYCDVLYTLNNNNNGNRRFGITNNGDIISMGRTNTGLTVQ
jgi:hypothetical protein